MYDLLVVNRSVDKSRMKIKQNPRVALLVLFTSALLCISSVGSVGMASVFEECLLDVDVLDINANNKLKRVDAITVKVVSVDSKNSYLCPFEVGQKLPIKNIENGGVDIADITQQAGLKIHFLNYSGVGPDGLVGGVTWKILKLIKRSEDSKDTTAK